MKAFGFGLEKHLGQLDKGGTDYFCHCLKVAGLDTHNINDVEPSEYLEKIVGLLHDTLEDTDTTFEELVEHFGQEVAECVNRLTKPRSMGYMPYIISLKQSGCGISVKVKIADLIHNMDLSRLKTVTKKDIERNRKYLDALEMLIG